MNLRWLPALFGSALFVPASLIPSSLAASPEARSGAEEAANWAQPSNLTVLPKDIPAARLKALMKRYTEELGVQCGHCHVEDPQSHLFDYASDDNPAKQTARLMITMLSDINTRYLSQLGDPRYSAHVTCGNCHQGQSDPPAFESNNR